MTEHTPDIATIGLNPIAPARCTVPGGNQEITPVRPGDATKRKNLNNGPVPYDLVSDDSQLIYCALTIAHVEHHVRGH